MLQRFAELGLSVVLFSDCYHATIETGLTPSATTIRKPWAHGFIYGLVPPDVLSINGSDRRVVRAVLLFIGAS
jgi:hypothetical protein